MTTNRPRRFRAARAQEPLPSAKTPEEAKAKIRDVILRQGAELAVEQAKQFVTELFAMDPVRRKLCPLAAKKRPAGRTTAPFTERRPGRIRRAGRMVKIAFKLNPDSPFCQADRRR